MRPPRPSLPPDLRRRVLFRLAAYSLILGFMALWLVRTREAARRAPAASPALAASQAALHAAVLALDDAERAAAEHFWGPELLAQRHGVVIERLWDSLNAATNALATLAAWPAGTVTLPRWGGPVPLGQGILEQPPLGPGPRVNEPAAALRAVLESGWRLDRSEWRHVRFAPGPPARSTVELALELSRADPEERVSLSGPLGIEWAGAAPEGASHGGPFMAAVDASQLVLRRRAGPPPFREVFFRTLEPFARTQ